MLDPALAASGTESRTSRWATTQNTEEATRNGSMPISVRRVTALGASLVCSVLSTRWPVSADSTAICAVSRSRISPTMITSGSARIIERSPVANVSPARRLTGIWVMPSSWYSTGSSIVTMFFSGELMTPTAPYSVVDLPEPVGPVTSTAPNERDERLSKRVRSSSAMPRLLSSMLDAVLVEDAHDADSP